MKQPTFCRGRRQVLGNFFSSKPSLILFTLACCSCIRLSSSLVTRSMQIQVNVPGFQDRETTTCSLNNPNIKSNINSNGKTTIPSSSSRRPRSRTNNYNYSSNTNNSNSSATDHSTFEEKEKRDLEWLVNATTVLLGPESPPLGTMTPGSVLHTGFLMSAWARREPKKREQGTPYRRTAAQTIAPRTRRRK
jgi:hypothetical protein